MPRRARIANRIRRAAIAALGPLAALALAAAPAHAATYTIDTCGASASTGDWHPYGPTDGAFLQTGHECPARDPGPDGLSEATRSGLWVTDTLASASDTPQGTDAGWEIDAPAGATISRAELWRIGHKSDDNGWRMYFKLGPHNDPTVPEQDDCTIRHVECAVGGWTWAPGAQLTDSYSDLDGLSAPAISFGVRCAADAAFPCLNGFDFYHVGWTLYEARLTLNDPTAPQTPAGAGEAWTSNDWLQGEQAVGVSGDDPQDGITATRFYIDGKLAGETDRRDTSACDWTRMHPCTAANAIPHTFDTAQLADGEHQMAIATVNAAGAETRATRPTPLRVDNHAPAPPTGLTATRDGDTNTFAINWQLPDDNGSPLTAARWQLCTPDCGPVHDADSLQQIDNVTLPSTSDGQLRVWIADQLGHENAAAAATVTLPYLAPPPPPPPPPPPSRGDDSHGDGGHQDDDENGSTARAPVVTPPVITPPSDGTGNGTDPAPGSTPATPPPGGVGDVDQPPTTPAQTPVKRAGAALRLLSLQRSATAVTLRGSIAKTATGKIAIALTASAGRRTVRRTVTARIRNGRWTARAALPRPVRSRVVTLTVRYDGTSAVRPAQLRRTVKSR